MVNRCVKGSSNQSRLNKNVSYIKIPDQERKDIRDAWRRAIARPVLSKAIHVFSDRFTEDPSDESQKLKRRLLGGSSKYIFKPDSVPPLFSNGKVVHKSVSSNIEKTIKLKGGKVSLFSVRIERSPQYCPDYILLFNVFLQSVIKYLRLTLAFV